MRFSDIAPLAALAAVVMAGVAMAFMLFPALRRRTRELLTTPEWIALLRLIAIVVMVLVILHVSLEFEFASQEFIYGRF